MSPGVILNDTQETEQITEEERKRDHRNALRRAAYWRNKDKPIKDQNKRPSGTSGIRLRSISVSSSGPTILDGTPPAPINQTVLTMF